MISRQRTAGSVSVPGIPGGWYPSVRGSTRSAARGQPRRQRPLPRPGGPRRRGGGAAPPRRAAHSPHPNTTGPHSSTPVHHRIHPRPSLSLSARACGPAAHAGSARAICCAGTRHHRANCSCATASSSTSALARPMLFAPHPVRRPPPTRQIFGSQPVCGRHPMHKRPRRLTHHGHHPQDRLHPTASPSPPDRTVSRSTRGTGRPIPVHGERASRVPGTGRSGGGAAGLLDAGHEGRLASQTSHTTPLAPPSPDTARAGRNREHSTTVYGIGTRLLIFS